MNDKTQILSWEHICGYACFGFASLMNVALALDIVTDGTLTLNPVTHLPTFESHILPGGNGIIQSTWGTISGNNLFHSFSKFNIDNGSIATFVLSTQDAPHTINNVISRVTGNDKSFIDGKLQIDSSTLGQPAFYFINPNGITFGQGAKVNVPGDFHVSTADKLDFKNNGGSFYVDPTKTSTLSNEPPASLGFLGTNSQNNGLIDINNASLFSSNNGKSLDVTARV